MKNTIVQLLHQGMRGLCEQGVVDDSVVYDLHVERTRDVGHGDFATNVALKLAKPANTTPRELAEKLVSAIPTSREVEKVEIAGPGFINFHLTRSAYLNLIEQIRQQDHAYGKSNAGEGKTVLLEFVSTNPTGPLHVGHGRGAAFGDALARVLSAAGFQTCSEYYLNDAGRQMDILTLSVWLRYLELCGETVEFPSNGYQGGYVREMAETLRETREDAYCSGTSGLFSDLPGEPESHLDALISRCKKLLGEEYAVIFDWTLDAMVRDIRQDLEEFGVVFQKWFSERSLFVNGDIESSIRTLEENGHIYEKDGAKWFRATDFGDEKDRVVVRANGVHTYFASDIAYHYNKAERGFHHIINIFGSDHHGYIQRIYASFEALGNAPERLKFLTVQFAVLYRNQEKISMSTRSGDFVTLRELREEVGNDAARFFYVMRKADQHMDFDIELAKSQSSDNPVYYIQYAHARISSVFRLLEEKEMPTLEDSVAEYDLLTEPQEMDLLKSLSRFPEVVELAAANCEPHQIAYYLRDLANAFHVYYNAHPFLSSEPKVRLARLGLIDATRIVLANGLAILGVRAPVQM